MSTCRDFALSVSKYNSVAELGEGEGENEVAGATTDADTVNNI